MTVSRTYKIDLAEMIRFGVVGALNTAIGLSVIFAGISLGLGDVSANVCGYAVGLTASFFLNRRWTFSHEGHLDARLLARYLSSFAIAYLSNLFVTLSLIESGLVPRPVGHVVGAIVYTALFYLFCRGFVFSARDVGKRNHPRAAAASLKIDAFALVLIALSCLLFWLLRDIPIGHDQSWYLVSAHKILEGAKPYRDLVEINPPLAFYLAVPPVYVAEHLGLSPHDTYIAYILLLAVVSVILARAELLKTNGISRTYANFAAALALVMVSAFPTFDYGQRDVLLIIFTLPYLALAARRLEGGDIHGIEAVLVGCWAAVGICLKPYFLLFPAATEAVLFLHRRNVLGRARPELLAILACGVVYAASIPLLFPAYLKTVVPLGRLTYFAYGVQFPDSLYRAEIVFIAIVLAAYPFLRRRSGHHRRLDLLVAWLIAGMLSYAIQNKGFSYHTVPMRIMLVFVIVDLFWADLKVHLALRVASKFVLGILLIMLSAQAYAKGVYHNGFAGELRKRVAHYGAPDGIYTFTAHLFIGFPLANDLNVSWDSRFPALWPIPGAVRILADPGRFSPEAVAAARDADRYVTRAVVEDFERRMPSIVIVDAREDKAYFGGVKFDYIANFERDPAFARLWKNYTLVDSYRDFQIWRKIPN